MEIRHIYQSTVARAPNSSFQPNAHIFFITLTGWASLISVKRCIQQKKAHAKIHGNSLISSTNVNIISDENVIADVHFVADVNDRNRKKRRSIFARAFGVGKKKELIVSQSENRRCSDPFSGNNEVPKKKVKRFGTMRVGRRRKSMPAEVGISAEQTERLKAMMGPSPVDFWTTVSGASNGDKTGKAPSKSAPTSPKSKSVSTSLTPSSQELSKTFVFNDEEEESALNDEEKESFDIFDIIDTEENVMKSDKNLEDGEK